MKKILLFIFLLSGYMFAQNNRGTSSNIYQTTEPHFRITPRADWLKWNISKQRYYAIDSLNRTDSTEFILARPPKYGVADTTQKMFGFYRIEQGTFDFSNNGTLDTTKHGRLVLPHFTQRLSDIKLGQIGTIDGTITVDSVPLPIKRIVMQTTLSRIDTVAYLSDLDSTANSKGYVTRTKLDTITGTKVFRFNNNYGSPNYVEFSKIAVSFTDSARFYFPQVAGDVAGSVWFDLVEGKFFGYTGADTVAFGGADSTALLNNNNTWLGNNVYNQRLSFGALGKIILPILSDSSAGSIYYQLGELKYWDADTIQTVATKDYVSTNLYLLDNNLTNWVRTFVNDSSHVFNGDISFGANASFTLSIKDDGGIGNLWRSGNTVRYRNSAGDVRTFATTTDLVDYGKLANVNNWTNYNTFDYPVTIGKANIGSGGINGGLTIYNATNAYYTALNPTAPTANRTLNLPNESGTLATQNYVTGNLYSATLNIENWVRTFVNDTSHVFNGDISFGTGAELVLPTANPAPSIGRIWRDTDVIKYTNSSGDVKTLLITESDPVFTGWSYKSTVETNTTNWNNASAWVVLYGSNYSQWTAAGNWVASYGYTDYVRTGDSRLSDSRPASDVYSWAKAASKPTYTYSEVGAQPAGSYLTAEVDGSTTNEIQTLGTSGNTITLTSGGSVTAPYATSAGSVTNGLYSTSTYNDPDWLASLGASKIVQSASYRFVTDTENSTWNGKADAFTGKTGTYTIEGVDGFWAFTFSNGVCTSVKFNGTEQ